MALPESLPVGWSAHFDKASKLVIYTDIRTGDQHSTHPLLDYYLVGWVLKYACSCIVYGAGIILPTSMPAHVFVHVRSCTHIHIHTQTRTCTHTRTHKCMHMHPDTYVHIDINIAYDMCTGTHTHTYAHTSLPHPCTPMHTHKLLQLECAG